MKYIVFLLVLILLHINSIAQQKNYTISGYIHEKGSKESMVGAPIYILELKNGTTTNAYGFFSITIPAMDSVTLLFSYTGFQSVAKRIKLDKNIQLNLDMEPASNSLKEVQVLEDHAAKVSQTSQMSTIDIPVEQIKDIPALLGEKDVLKVLQLMPGVQKGGEGSSGFYVRGGGPDQNLIILDDAPVYNAFHLFGFFSLFNGDALKSVELTKGGFPARYGGRLSSVLDMRMKEGNKEKIHGEGGIGLVSSRLTLEGPLYKNKSSFLISARRTYIDILTAPLIRAASSGATAGYFFYDLNAKLNYDFGDRNKLFVSGYFGKDKFYFKQRNNFFSDDSFSGSLGWGNATATARWNHLYSSKVFSNTSLILSDYKFLTGIEEKSAGNVFNLKYYSGIRDYGIKYDLDYHPNLQHYVRGGLMSSYHLFTLQAITVKDTYTPENDLSKKTATNGLETSVYVEDDYKPIPLLRINGGVRLSNFNLQSKNYFRVEPRLSASYNIMEDVAIKASYADMNQYIHLVSNTNVGLPTDLWVPSTKNIAPQHSRQVAAGIAKDFLGNNLAITLEGYYKQMNNVLGFKEGASFLDVGASADPNNTQSFKWERNVTAGRGWSYGGELLIQRKFGKLSGWIGYTLSWTQLQFDSLNFGKKFYAKYDRRHDISVVGIYKVLEETADHQGITISGTWVYGTGNAITLPVSSYTAPTNNVGNTTPYNNYNYGGYSEYTEKNAFRMAPYHRFDIGLQFHKKKKYGERTWEVSVYNLYNRKNPYFYYVYSSSNGRNVLKQVSLFPLIPSISWNFKF